MASSKRSGGKGFGKPPLPPGVDSSFDFEGLIDGNRILVANAIIDEIKGVGDFYTLLGYKDLTGNFSSFKPVIEIAFNPANIYLAKRRQLEEGRGMLTLTPKGYRQQWGLADESDGEIVFNWWTLPELKVAQQRSYIFGGTRIIAKLAEPLIIHSKNRFPVICHAVPFSDGDSQQSYAHLMFTVSLDPERSTEHRQVNLLERETIPLLGV